MNRLQFMFSKFPQFKGKSKLVRFLFSKTIGRAKDILIKGKYSCTYLLPNLIENVSFDIYVNGIYEHGTLEFLAKRIPLNGVFLDLGANIGAVSTPLSKRRKDIRIICVEASPWVFKYLDRNLHMNGLSGIDRINRALFHTDNIELDFFAPHEKFGKGSLSPVFTANAERVTTMRVDTMVRQMDLPRVDMIKIDVEGYEYHVFKGAEALLSRPDSPDIFFEFVDWAEDLAKDISVGDAQRLLKSWGYNIYRFNENKQVLDEANGVIVKGACMLYATKKLKNASAR